MYIYFGFNRCVLNFDRNGCPKNQEFSEFLNTKIMFKRISKRNNISKYFGNKWIKNRHILSQYYRFSDDIKPTSNVINEQNNDILIKIEKELNEIKSELSVIKKKTQKRNTYQWLGTLMFLPPFILYFVLFLGYRASKKELLQKRVQNKVINIKLSQIIQHGYGDLFSGNDVMSFQKLIKLFRKMNNDNTVRGISIEFDGVNQFGFGCVMCILPYIFIYIHV